jgi:hypothetical protein
MLPATRSVLPVSLIVLSFVILVSIQEGGQRLSCGNELRCLGL